MCEGIRDVNPIDTEVQMGSYSKELSLDWMFYTLTVGEGQLFQHRSSSFGSIKELPISASSISLDIILPVGSKDSCILRDVYGFSKNP